MQEQEVKSKSRNEQSYRGGRGRCSTPGEVEISTAIVEVESSFKFPASCCKEVI